MRSSAGSPQGMLAHHSSWSPIARYTTWWMCVTSSMQASGLGCGSVISSSCASLKSVVMCACASAEPSAAGCGVPATLPSGCTRSDSFSMPRRMPRRRAPASGRRRSSRRLIGTRRSAYGEQLDFENQRRVRRDRAAGAARAVAELGRNDELAPPAHLHALHAFVPALDDVAGGEREFERGAALLARIELAALLAAVEQPPGVVHADFLAGARLGTFAEGEVLDHESAGCGDFGHGSISVDAWLSGGEPRPRAPAETAAPRLPRAAILPRL